MFGRDGASLDVVANTFWEYWQKALKALYHLASLYCSMSSLSATGKQSSKRHMKRGYKRWNMELLLF